MLAVEQIKGDEYTVEHDPGAHTVTFKGTIRLQTSDDYLPMTQLLQAAHDSAAGERLSLDFRQLQFLNSSGISTISKFVIGAASRISFSSTWWAITISTGSRSRWAISRSSGPRFR